MRLVVNLLGGLLAVGWAGVAADYFAGAARARRLEDQPPYSPKEGPEAPPLSVVVAACNEEATLPAAFRTLLAQDYPGEMEIVAVDDRSTDRTPAVLTALAQEAAGTDKRVILLQVRELPEGWLGKNHALYQGAARAAGRWILFTDADVRFAPDALSRAVRYAEREGRVFVAAFPGLDLRGFWERVFGHGFLTLFFLRFRPWHVRDPRRPEYLGVGAFALIRRDAYRAIGTHRALALEVADDMELARRAKSASLPCDALWAKDLVRVRWQEGGLRGLMDGLTKNAYAGLDYSPWVLLRSTLLLLGTVVGPFVALALTRGRTRAAFAFSAAAVTSIGAWHARTAGIPALYGAALPLSAPLLIVVMLRSAWRAETRGGIAWRGTEYPLSALRARAVPPVPPPVGLLGAYSPE